MSKILGLDLGTNSIGWALIDDKENKILGTGSRIFPEGVENLGEGEGRETSKNASRTDARGTRRQFFRRRLRKRYLLRELAKNQFCPVDFEKVKIWTNKKVFDDEQFKEWIRLNPYELRAKAINEEISLVELGRIFYHMIQRRGFLSNSRSAGAENNEKSVIFIGDTKIGKIGISETTDSIEDNKTLGSYLNQIQPKEHDSFKQDLERIRNRYTTRQMYIDEFEQIWEKQKVFHSELTNELKTLLGGRKKDGYAEDGVLFHQRPLRSQKHLVGNCSFEPKKTKCQLSAIPFEEFRVYQWVNTVECNGKKLNEQEREILVQQLFNKEKPNFMALRKVIKKADSSFQFNYKDDDRIVGTHTISQLSSKKFFGANWFDFTEKEQEDIWHVLYSFEDRDKLKQYANTNWGFDEEKASKISKFNLKDGYANLSRKAINNILPFLKLGFTYDLAVVLGGIKNAFGENWNSLEEEKRNLIIDNIYDIVRNSKKGGFIDTLKSFLKSDYNLAEKQLSKLYHHSATIDVQEIVDKLPVDKNADKEIQSIRNPIVTTALFEIRKLVNEIIDNYDKPDQIKVELARDLKISKTKRREIRLEQQRLERETDRVKAELDYIGQRYTHDTILKYKLWEECNKTCPYTGKQIQISQLFSGEVQIEHIFPWSRSLNDSFMNKTLCFADENRAKGDLTPYEFYNKKGFEKWEQIKAQALSCFKNKKGYPKAYNKFKQFIKKEHDSDFISRQLNDTRYISKEAKNYLSKICNNVQVAPGQMTANLRQKWGLNSILNDENTKSRDDHRHHAVDALVMACSSRNHLQELSKWNRYHRTGELKDFPMPWTTFRQDAEKAIDQILVSHKKTDNLLTIRTSKTKKNGVEYKNVGVAARGQLHLDTVYGKRKDVFTGKEAYHVRKQLVSLTPAEVPKIVDSSIHKLVERRIEGLGLKINEKDRKPIVKLKEEKKLFEQLFNEPLFLPNKNGEPVPIKKIRIRKNFGNAVALDNNEKQWVDLGKNHHVLIYKNEKEELQEDVVTFWVAVERKKQKQAVIQLPPEDKKGEIVTTLQINDIFLLGLKEEDIDWENPNNDILKKHLYRVQKLSSKFYEFRLVTESKIDKKDMPYYCRIQSFGEGKTGWLTFNPIKVKITSIGKIMKV
ncbi:MAG: type II CRISPR RNA-guided endonuclease Cas9 [Flavobacteriales bacterium]|nr:type II CRISPR RNA-guided endonuclease Cas9 [Flavobacteriales bacterium]